MRTKTIPVYIPGTCISDNGELVINADEMDAAGVRKLEFIEVKPTEAGSGEAETPCECGHSADTHDPCCVSACGCDGFEPRKRSVEEVFKAVLREIKQEAEYALGYEQICEPIQAVRRLAQEFAAVKAQLADARAYNERAPKIAAEVGNARAEKAEAEAARLRTIANKLWGAVNDRRCTLIQWKAAGDVSERDLAELAELQALADEWQSAVAPLPIAELEAYMKSMGIEVPEEDMVCLRCGGDCMGQLALTPEAAPAGEVKE